MSASGEIQNVLSRKTIEVAAPAPRQVNCELRAKAVVSDIDAVRAIAASTDFFTRDELDIAVELIEDRVEQGAASEYQFLFADVDGQPVAFACYGPIACTVGSYDLYWIAVRSDRSGGGIGRTLLNEVERRIALEGGRRMYVETSARDQYAPTRRFYERCGYHVDAVQNDFYAPGDGKVTLVKIMA